MQSAFWWLFYSFPEIRGRWLRVVRDMFGEFARITSQVTSKIGEYLLFSS